MAVIVSSECMAMRALTAVRLVVIRLFAVLKPHNFILNLFSCLLSSQVKTPQTVH